MSGDTHEAGGMLVSILGFGFLKYNNMLLPDVPQLLQLVVMYPFVMWGSVAPDFDHHWASCPKHDYPAKIVNTGLHATAFVGRRLDKKLTKKQKQKSLLFKMCMVFYAKHRSWQTHSDLTIALLVGLEWSLLSGKILLSEVARSIALLVITGIIFGVLAHLFLDMLNPDGIHSLLLELVTKKLPIKVKTLRLVPDKSYFATGGVWEAKVLKLLLRLTYIALVVLLVFLIYPYLPFELEFRRWW